MSGTAPNAGGEETGVDVLAGEYVLGLLDNDAARAVERRALADPAMADAIADWQDRFEPLADLASPATPSEALWPRIAAGLRPTPTIAQAAPAANILPMHPPASRPARPGAWRGLALVSMALAAGLALFIVWPRQAAIPGAPWPRAVALLSAPGSPVASWRAQLTASGVMTVLPLQHQVVAADRLLGFRAWPASEKAPVLLGMIGAAGGQLKFPFPPREGTPVMVTLEKAGAAPGSAPGPTLSLGLLVAGPAV
jgi:anti-sigma-K factor RskA